MFDIFKGCNYLHTRTPPIIHRDIKPENLLLDSHMNIKLCDFGWCALKMPGASRYTFCGTVEYMPPEILLGNIQSFGVDIWALGVLLYELVYKKPPFGGRTPHQVLTKMQTEGPQFDNKIDPEIKDLITKILVLDPNRRIKLKEIKNHPYFKRFDNSLSTMASSKNLNL